MDTQLQYLTDAGGERVGVLLSMEEYRHLTLPTTGDPELLLNISQAELHALAESVLIPATQSRLTDLLVRNQESTLSAAEEAELDQLLATVDQLNILKTRACHTLDHLKKASHE